MTLNKNFTVTIPQKQLGNAFYKRIGQTYAKFTNILQPNINFNLFILLLSIPCKAILYKYSTTYMHFVDFLLIFNN